FGIAERQQWALLQVEREEAKPQPVQGDGQYQVELGGHRARSEFRPCHLEKIHEPYEDQLHGNLRDNLSSAFQVLREQQEKSNKKVEDDHDQGDNAPFAIQPRAIEADLFGLVARPDDQQLGEIEIGLKHDKREKQLAQVVEMARLEDS